MLCRGALGGGGGGLLNKGGGSNRLPAWFKAVEFPQVLTSLLYPKDEDDHTMMTKHM